MKFYFILLFLLFSSVSLVMGAITIGDSADSTERVINLESPAQPLNYSSVNVNNSQFLQNLNPQQVANLFTSAFLYNQTGLGSFAYNMTTPAISFISKNTSGTFIPYNGSIGNVNLNNKNLSNINLLTVNGTMSIRTPVRNATIIGDVSGNARGIRSMDIQSSRNLATEVASGSESVAFGSNILANETQSLGIGFNIISAGTQSFLIGRDIEAIGASNMIYIGAGGGSYADDTLNIGTGSIMTGAQALSVGNSNTVSGVQGTAIGNSQTVTTDGTAIGNGNYISSTSGVALGLNNIASGTSMYDQIIFGSNIETYGFSVVAFGSSYVTYLNESMVFGQGREQIIVNNTHMKVNANITSSGLIEARAGGSETYAKVGGTLFYNSTDKGNSGTAETTLYLNNITINTLSRNGESLRVSYSGNFTSHATATKELRLYFNNTNIYDSGAIALATDQDWQLDLIIVKTGTTTAESSVTLQTTSASSLIYAKHTDLTGLDFTKQQYLNLTGQSAGVGGASNQENAQFVKGEWLP